MSEPGDRLHRVRTALEPALRRMGAAHDPSAIAELLWLASVERGARDRPRTGGESGRPGSGAEGPRPTRTDDGPRAGPTRGDEEGGDGHDEPTDASAGEGRDDSDPTRPPRDPPPPRPETAHIPQGATVPALLPLVRALRPLRTRRDGPPGERVEEAATVRRITEEGVWEPVRAPTRVAEWSATLVVDDARSMALWSGRLGEITRMLRQLGAFAGVGWKHLRRADAALREGPPPGVRPGLPPDPSPPDGRHVVLVVTDGLDARWQDGRAAAALAPLARLGAVSFLHLLPADLWPRTRLGRQRAPVTLTGGRVDSPPPLPWEEGTPPALPGLLVDLDEGSLAAWARRLSRQSGPWQGGVLLDRLPPDAAQAAPPPARPDGATRTRTFLANSSRDARRFAALLSLAPDVDQALARAVREAALPGAGFGIEAEVLLGGILDPIDDETGATGRLRMLPEAQAALRRELRGSDVPALYAALGKWLTDRPDLPNGFAGILADPGSAAGAVVLDPANPLVRALLEGMRAAGGAWAELADEHAPAFSEEDEAAWTQQWREWIEGVGVDGAVTAEPARLTSREARAVRRRSPTPPRLDASVPVERTALQLEALVRAPRPAPKDREADDVARAALAWALVRALASPEGPEPHRRDDTDTALFVLLAAAWWDGAVERAPSDGPGLDAARRIVNEFTPADGAWEGAPTVVAWNRLRDALRTEPAETTAGGVHRLRFTTLIGTGTFAPEAIPALEHAIAAAGHTLVFPLATDAERPWQLGDGPLADVVVLFGELSTDTPSGWTDGAVVVTFPGTRPDMGSADHDDNRYEDDRGVRRTRMLMAAAGFTPSEQARLVVDLAEIESDTVLVGLEEQVLVDVDRFLRAARRLDSPTSSVQGGPPSFEYGVDFDDDPQLPHRLAGILKEHPQLGSVLGWALLQGAAIPPSAEGLTPAAAAGGERLLPWLRHTWLKYATTQPGTLAGQRGIAMVELFAHAAAPDGFEAWAEAVRTATLATPGPLDPRVLAALLALGVPSADAIAEAATGTPNARHWLYVLLRAGDRDDAANLLTAAFLTELRDLGDVPEGEARWQEAATAFTATTRSVPERALLGATTALEWAATDRSRQEAWGPLRSARKRWVDWPGTTDALGVAAGRFLDHAAANAPREQVASKSTADAIRRALGHLAEEPPLQPQALLPRRDAEPVLLARLAQVEPTRPDALAALNRLAWPAAADRHPPRWDVALALAAEAVLTNLVALRPDPSIYAYGPPAPDGPAMVAASEHARALLALRARTSTDVLALTGLTSAVDRALNALQAMLTARTSPVFEAPAPTPRAAPDLASALGYSLTTRAKLGEICTAVQSADQGPPVCLLPLGQVRGDVGWLVFTPEAVAYCVHPPRAGAAKIEWLVRGDREPEPDVQRDALVLGGHRAPYDPSRFDGGSELWDAVGVRWQLAHGKLAGPTPYPSRP